jgi:alpha-tubulin suppressor-like RCC1 family protein
MCARWSVTLMCASIDFHTLKPDDLVNAGDSHTVALTEQGYIYGWGTYRDSSGVYGFSPEERIALVPTLVYSPKSAAEQVVKIGSGRFLLPAAS